LTLQVGVASNGFDLKNNRKKTQMKKILLALLVLALAAASASAGVGISWLAAAGYDHNDDSTPILTAYSVTWQLIYAGADNTMNPASITTGGANGDYVTGDDVVWATRIVPQGGGIDNLGNEWDDLLTAIDDSYTSYIDLSWNTAGYVYQRAFEGTPAAGSWYYEGGWIALNLGYTGPPQFYQDSYIESESEPFVPDQQFPIPEPATMSLLGLGALVMAFRRRRS
jgi:hypothetical protein